MEHKRVLQAACFFKERILSIICEEIKRLEQEFWEQVKSIDIDDIKEEVDDWVVHPR